VVNVQGDEPLVSANHIELVASALEKNTQAGISTLASQIEDIEDVFDSNIVKVVMDHQGNALYFSRAVIPWDRDSFSIDCHSLIHKSSQNLIENHWFRHIGLYAYRVATLKKYLTLPVCPLEEIESLEQLRVLYNGISIHVSVVDDQPGHGVDVAADITRIEKLLKNQL